MRRWKKGQKKISGRLMDKRKRGVITIEPETEKESVTGQEAGIDSSKEQNKEMQENEKSIQIIETSNGESVEKIEPENRISTQEIEPEIRNAAHKIKPENRNSAQKIDPENGNSAQKIELEIRNSAQKIERKNENSIQKMEREYGQPYQKIKPKNENSIQKTEKEYRQSSHNIELKNGNSIQNIEPENDQIIQKIEQGYGGEEMKAENKNETSTVQECKIYYMTGRERSRKRRTGKPYSAKADLQARAIRECMTGQVQSASTNIEKGIKVGQNIEKKAMASHNIEKETMASQNIEKQAIASPNMDKGTKVGQNIEKQTMTSHNIEKHTMANYKKKLAKQIPFPVNYRENNRVSIEEARNHRETQQPMNIEELTNIILNCRKVSGLNIEQGKLPYSVLDYSNSRSQVMVQGIQPVSRVNLSSAFREYEMYSSGSINDTGLSASIQSCAQNREANTLCSSQSNNINDVHSSLENNQVSRGSGITISSVVNQAQKGREEINCITTGRQKLSRCRKLRYWLGSIRVLMENLKKWKSLWKKINKDRHKSQKNRTVQNRILVYGELLSILGYGRVQKHHKNYCEIL